MTNRRQWTKELPTKPGQYWQAWPDGRDASIVTIATCGGRLMECDRHYVDPLIDGEFIWAGPVSSPDDQAYRNIGMGLAFVGYYFIGESIGMLLQIRLIEEAERAYNEGFDDALKAVASNGL